MGYFIETKRIHLIDRFRIRPFSLRQLKVRIGGCDERKGRQKHGFHFSATEAFIRDKDLSEKRMGI